MREIPLGRSGQFVALVDDEDYERLAERKWHGIRRHGWLYAVRAIYPGGVRRLIAMHREVLGFPDAPCVDHANGDSLDNRRANLRACTSADNARNIRAISGKRIKGVQCLEGRWRARIRIDGRLTHIGSFATELEAAQAYDAAARKHFGEFACVNFPVDGERGATAA